MIANDADDDGPRQREWFEAREAQVKVDPDPEPEMDVEVDWDILDTEELAELQRLREMRI